MTSTQEAKIQPVKFTKEYLTLLAFNLAIEYLTAPNITCTLGGQKITEKLKHEFLHLLIPSEHSTDHKKQD